MIKHPEELNIGDLVEQLPDHINRNHVPAGVIQPSVTELWNLAMRKRFWMWAKIGGIWKHVVAYDQPTGTIRYADWQAPSEIGRKFNEIDIHQVEEFDLTA